MFGGALAAAAVLASRPLAPGRAPASLDIRFLRALRGPAAATVVALNEGGTLTTTSVEFRNADGRLVCGAVVGLVALERLSSIEFASEGGAPTAAGGRAWRPPPGVRIPIVETLAPRAVGIDAGAVGSAFAPPWDGAERTAEGVCMVADLCVGPPVGAAVADRGWVPHPNPDLSVRFAPPVASEGDLVGVGRLRAIRGGLGIVDIDVWVGDALAAVGVSSSLLLGGGAE